MQNNVQTFNEALFEKKVDDLKKFFQEKKLTHHTTAENKKSRSGYIEISKILKNYGFFPKEYLEDFSSGEESDIDDEKMNEPSVREVSEKVVDFRAIVNVKKIAHIPKNARPGIIITNLDDWVTIPIIKRFIEDIPLFCEERIIPEISDVRILNYKGILFAFILLLNIDHSKKIFSYFNHPQKLKYNPTKNSKGEKMEIFYAFDLLDMENSEWYGVVLRNIPEKCSHENLKNHLANYSKNINSLLPAMKIKSSFCSLVVLNSIEDAEKICICLNKKEKGKNRYIKAHLHPRTCHMRKYPENSIFNNYFKLENGNYFKKYFPNNLGNILSSNFSNIKSKFTPINIILSDLNSLNSITAQQQSNNPISNSNNNQENKKNSIDEINKNHNIKEKENTANKTRQNNLNLKDSVNGIGVNNLFKKTTTDFLNFDFDLDEKNKKKPTFDMNISYLTKLIMKPSTSNTNKVEENNPNSSSNPNDSKALLNDLSLNQNENSCSSINAFINDLDANKKLNLKSVKDNVIKDNSNKNLIGSLKKLDITANKNDLVNIQPGNKKGLIPKIKQNSSSNLIKDNESCKFADENKTSNQQQLSYNTNLNRISKVNEDDLNPNKSNDTLIFNKQPSEVQNEEFNNIICNEEKLNKSTTGKKEAKYKESTKKVETSSTITNNCSSQISPNKQQLSNIELNKLSGSNSNLNNPISNNNLVKNESIISNLSGILKEMVKSDKEKIMKTNLNEIDEKSASTINKNTQIHNDFSIRIDDKKNLDGNNSNFENQKMIIDSGNLKINNEESEEEIIELNNNSHYSEFFKYDFQEKSYYEKPKNHRMQSKPNKDDKYSNTKSMYDRSRDREREKERERDKNNSYQKNNERSSKKYNSSFDENYNNKNFNQENNYNNYNTEKVSNLNSLVSCTNQSNTKTNEITNIQNIYISNYNDNPNIPTVSVSSNNKSLNQDNSNNIQTLNNNLNNSINSKSRFSNFSSTTVANYNHSSQKDSKHSSTRILELRTSITANNQEALETGNLPPVLNNINVKKTTNQQQNGNQPMNTNNSNNNINFISNTSQQQSIQNNNKSHSQSQFHSQPSANIIYQNNPHLSNHPQQNNYFSGKISSNNQIPFNPIIQNNSTIINNFINIIPPQAQSDLTKELNKNQNPSSNLNHQQYSQSNPQNFNNIAFSGATGNIPNVNIVFPKNTKIIKNNMNVSSNIQGQQGNFVSITNLHQPQASQQNIPNNKKTSSNNSSLILNVENNSLSKNSNLNTLINPSTIINKVESKNEIILPPLDDFVPPLPPENPPEPEGFKGDESEKLKEKSILYEKVLNKKEIGLKTINNIHNNINFQSNVYINTHEKTEPGQILTYDSEEESNAINKNLQGYRSKKIDVKNAPINFKKYNLSKSSSSSSNSYKKSKEFINRKREREKQRKYSKEREKERKKKKHRSRSKERSFTTNNNMNDDKYLHANRKDNRDNKLRNEKKYNENLKKYSKQEENRSSSSSSSIQSGEDGRYYKRLLERRTNSKKEKR